MSEFTTLAENDNYIMRCRTEYYNENKKRVWSGIHYKFEGNTYCVWLGYVYQDTDLKQFLIDRTKDLTFEDKRDKGYYCVYCKKFSDKAQMGWGIGIVRDGENENNRWVVKDHYDGCRGWD